MKSQKLIILLIIICLLSLALISCGSNNYTVNFETNGGSKIDAAKIGKNPTFTLPDTAPTKDGFIFVDWYFDNDTFLIPVTSEAILEKFNSEVKEITVYAKWTEGTVEKGTFLINFETNGGSGVTSLSIDQTATTFTMPSPPSKPNYFFEGWYFDNGTYLDKASVTSILTKLSSSLSHVTVYAKWGNVPQDSFNNFAKSLDVFYTGVNVEPPQPSNNELEQLRILLTNLYPASEKTLEELYWEVNSFLQNWDNDLWENYKTFQRYNALMAKKEKLDESEQAELKQIYRDQHPAEPDEPDPLDDEYEQYYQYTQDWISNNNQFEHLYQYKQNFNNTEYHDIVKKVIEYEEYSNKREAFLAQVDSYVASISANDIRTIKVDNLASFLNNYDYSTLLKTNTYDNETYFTINPARLGEFILEMRTTCELTKEDIGTLTYKFMVCYFNNEIANIGQRLLQISDKIDANIDLDFDLNYLYEELQFLTESKDSLQSLSQGFNLDYITEALDLVWGVLDIVNTNKVIDKIFDTTSNENAPSIGEIATVVASVKTACDQLITTFTSSDFSNSIVSLNAILTSLEDTDSYLAEFAKFSKTVLPQNPIESLTKFSKLLGLFTENNLGVFLINQPATETSTSKIVLNDNDAQHDNLAILEAKIIKILTDGVYDQEKVGAAYDTFFSGLSNFLPSALYLSDNVGSDNCTYAEKTLSKHLSNIIFSNLKAYYVITEETYSSMLDIANYDFIVNQDPTMPINIDSLVFLPEFESLSCYMDLTDSITENIYALYDSYQTYDEVFKNPKMYALMLYALNIEPNKLEQYNDYIKSLLNGNHNPITNKAMLFAYAFDGLFGENKFTDEDILAVLEILASEGKDYLIETLQSFGEEFDALITTLETESTSTDISFLVFNSLKLSSSLMVCANRKIYSVEQLANAFADAKVLLDEFILEEKASWENALLTLESAMSQLKLIERISEYVDFIDYFINAPDNSITNLSNILALFDVDMLNIFVSFEDNSLKANTSDLYFGENLIILEAKILDIIIGEGEENNADNVLALYTHLTEFLQTNAMNIFSDIFDQENSEVMQAAFPKALELFLAELEKEFVIGTPRLEGIQTLSAYAFVTGETNPITDQNRETVIFCNLIGKIFEYIDISRSILEAIDALYLSDFEQSDNQIYISQNATLELAALLYINSIDIEYLYAYNENLEALKSTSYADTTPFSKENYLTFASLLIDSLYEVGFSNEDITNITNTINQLLLSYASGKGQLANTEDNLEIINNFTSKILDVLELCAEHLLDISQPHILQYNNLLSITTIVDGDGKAVNVREAIITAANDVLTLLTGDGKNVLDIYIKNALYLSFDNATSIWYNLLTLEEFTVKDAELVGYLQTIYNLIDNGFDLHKVITSTIAALNEFNANELSNEINSTIFKAKIIAGIFGEDASSVINLVYPNETLRQLTNEFLAIYDDILILASYDYGEQSDDFNTALNNFNAFIIAH